MAPEEMHTQDTAEAMAKAIHDRRQSPMVIALHTEIHHKTDEKSTPPRSPNQAKEGLCINIRVKKDITDDSADQALIYVDPAFHM